MIEDILDREAWLSDHTAQLVINELVGYGVPLLEGAALVGFAVMLQNRLSDAGLEPPLFDPPGDED